MSDVGCGMWDVGCGMWDVGVGCGGSGNCLLEGQLCFWGISDMRWRIFI
jgi:hypothetical protein